MPIEFASFAFIITLAAVVNGLGIVRWLTGFAEYLGRKDSMTIEHYWVYTLTAVFQFILHVLLWWSMWSVRGATTLNFLTYLYLLMGPVLMFLGSAFLTPNLAGDRLNLRSHYYAVRPTYSMMIILVWLWGIFATPVFRGQLAEHWPVFVMFLAAAVSQRVTDNHTVHRTAAVLNWLLLTVFIATYAIDLGGLAPTLD